MSESTALCILGVAFFAFIGVVSIFGDTLADRNREIGIECVKSGGQWLSSWGVMECVREVKK